MVAQYSNKYYSIGSYRYCCTKQLLVHYIVKLSKMDIIGEETFIPNKVTSLIYEIVVLLKIVNLTYYF